MTIDNKREQIWESLRDPEYRHQFVEEEINVGIAFQIRSLRNRQNLKQAKLANRLGVKQPLVSSWENPDYGRYSLGTLKDLAKAFDVGLLVRFVPFSTLVDWALNLTSDTIAPPSFGEEEKYHITMPDSTSFNPVRDVNANSMSNPVSDFINRIDPAKFLSTVPTNPKEEIYA
jgi:transcriptional regulator with XRE-family HTH domain